MWILKRRNGQSMAEYAIILTVVITAVVAMQVYMKRSIQGKVKDVTDNLGWGMGPDASGTPFPGADLTQYEPYYAKTRYGIQQDFETTEGFVAKGKVTRGSIKEKNIRTGSAETGGSGELGQDSGWKP